MKAVDVMTDVFEQSKKWFRISIAASCALVLLSITGVFNLSKEQALTFSILSVLAQVSAFIARYLAEERQSLGEEIKRFYMCSEGLGIKISKHDWTQLAQKAGKTTFEKNAAGNEYYDSKLPAGPKRLVEIIFESSFWTCSLTKTAELFFFGISALAGLGFLISFVVIICYSQNKENLNIISSAFLTLMAFVASSDFLNFKIKFAQLHATSCSIAKKCEDLLTRESPPTIAESLLLFNDYTCATSSAPPIPTWIHKRNAERLNKIWRDKSIQ